jgi:fatty acyl-CoA reductase
MTWGLFGMYVAAFWRAQERPRKRTTDDIRFDMFPVQEFKQRFDIRFGEQIRTMAQLKEKEGKRLKIRISKAMAIPLTFKTFSCNEWFFDITKTLEMDDAAPKELKSGLRRGLDWHQYMEDYNQGVQNFILRERIDRSLVIDYSVQQPGPPQPQQQQQGSSSSASSSASASSLVPVTPKPEVAARL